MSGGSHKLLTDVWVGIYMNILKVINQLHDLHVDSTSKKNATQKEIWQIYTQIAKSRLGLYGPNKVMARPGGSQGSNSFQRKAQKMTQALLTRHQRMHEDKF